MMIFARSFFPDEDTWRRNNPVELASATETNLGASFYLTCGAKDSWGCMNGSEKIVEVLRAKGAKIEWHPRAGGHCDIDADSVAKFLLPE